MEESKENLDQKKIAIKMGGGGIGAVVLFGGALATAALASAFVAGKNGWSSGKDRRRRMRTPEPRENKQKEEGGAENGEQIVLDEPSRVYKNPRFEEMKAAESDHNTPFLVSNQCSHSSSQDEKLKSEYISYETPHNTYNIETSDERSRCPITLEKTETHDFCNGSVVIGEHNPLSDEKSRNEPHHPMLADQATTIQLPARVLVDEERSESEPTYQIAQRPSKGEESDEVCLKHEDVKALLVDKPSDEALGEKVFEKQVDVEKDLETMELEYDGETMFSENVSIVPVVDHENEYREEEKHVLPYDIVEIIKESVSFEGCEEDDRSNGIEEPLIEKKRIPDGKKEENELENDNPVRVEANEELPCIENNEVAEESENDELVREFRKKVEVMNDHKGYDLEKNIREVVEVDLALELNPPENVYFEKDIQEEAKLELIPSEEISTSKYHKFNDLEKNTEFELITSETVEVKKERKNIKPENDIEMKVEVESKVKSCQKYDLEKDIKEKDEAEITFDIEVTQSQDHVKRSILEEIKGLASKTVVVTDDNLVIENSDSEKQDEKKTIEDFSNKTVLSKDVLIVDREGGGKIQEDKSVKKHDHNSHNKQTESKIKKSYIEKYMAELAMLKEIHFVSSTSIHRMIIIATLCMASSLSCSWLLGLSSAKLCIVVCTTMLLSSMVVLSSS